MFHRWNIYYLIVPFFNKSGTLIRQNPAIMLGNCLRVLCGNSIPQTLPRDIILAQTPRVKPTITLGNLIVINFFKKSIIRLYNKNPRKNSGVMKCYSGSIPISFKKSLSSPLISFGLFLSGGLKKGLFFGFGHIKISVSRGWTILMCLPHAEQSPSTQNSNPSAR